MLVPAALAINAEELSCLRTAINRRESRIYDAIREQNEDVEKAYNRLRRDYDDAYSILDDSNRKRSIRNAKQRYNEKRRDARLEFRDENKKAKRNYNDDKKDCKNFSQ